MSERLFFATLRSLAVVTTVAFVWITFFDLNDLIFSGLAHSSRAHWVFLPAALRIFAVLLFDRLGAMGLVIGAYLTLPHDPPGVVLSELMLAVSSGVSPLIAVALCHQISPIEATLAGLSGRQIVLLSIFNACANSVLVNACLAVAGRWHGDIEQLITIFVGDLLGSAILLFLIATLVSIAPRRRL